MNPSNDLDTYHFAAIRHTIIIENISNIIPLSSRLTQTGGHLFTGTWNLKKNKNRSVCVSIVTKKKNWNFGFVFSFSHLL